MQTSQLPALIVEVLMALRLHCAAHQGQLPAEIRANSASFKEILETANRQDLIKRATGWTLFGVPLIEDAAEMYRFRLLDA